MAFFCLSVSDPRFHGKGGAQYFYVVTAVESKGGESAFSNEVSADIPN
jgi:fibronectin type 3 domain-containing protein